MESKHLLGLLVSCPGLLHVTVQHNLAIKTYGQLDKNQDQRKNRGTFWENIKFSLNLYEI